MTVRLVAAPSLAVDYLAITGRAKRSISLYIPGSAGKSRFFPVLYSAQNDSFKIFAPREEVPD
jgi:hypothetical protein